jgi:hypothetical protein
MTDVLGTRPPAWTLADFLLDPNIGGLDGLVSEVAPDTRLLPIARRVWPTQATRSSGGHSTTGSIDSAERSSLTQEPEVVRQAKRDHTRHETPRRTTLDALDVPGVSRFRPTTPMKPGDANSGELHFYFGVEVGVPAALAELGCVGQRAGAATVGTFDSRREHPVPRMSRRLGTVRARTCLVRACPRRSPHPGGPGASGCCSACCPSS